MKKLLQNGTILSFHEETDSVKVLRETSILIDGDSIVDIGPNLRGDADTKVINVTGKIVSPGVINTHSHIWQTAFRTMGPDTTLAEYFATASQYSPAIKSFSGDDLYICSLAGYYEGLNAGVTTVLEHAHNSWSADVFRAGWEATVDCGARVWWCPSVEDRENYTAEDQAGFMRKLGERSAEIHPLVSLGLAWDSLGTATDKQIEQRKEFVKDLNLEAMTLHFIGGEGSPWPVPDTSPTTAARANLQGLGIPIIFSHGGFVSESDQAALRDYDWNLSITPESEMHYGHGQNTSRFIQDQASLGIDTNWTFSGDILTQARLWLQNVRGTAYNKTVGSGLIPRQSPMTVEDAFLLATRQGGRALRRNDLGVIKKGAKADIIVFDGDTPNMAGWTDPVAAVMLHANVGDIRHVLVGGEFRKRDGKLILQNGGEWPEFQAKFAEIARRIQSENSAPPKMGEKFWGVGEWGDVEVMSTRRHMQK